MQTYTVLLVDDEEEVIQIISKKIPWEKIGFRILGYALNGVKALEMAEELEPDVVMTDIRMPFMDGLELSRRLKKEFPDIHILLFTGFDEFEYAKTAIHLEVDDYILKPMNAKELVEIFTKLKENLDNERRQKKDIENLKDYYLKTIPVVQSELFRKVLDGEQIDERQRDTLDQSLHGPYYAVAVVHISAHHLPPDMEPVYVPIAVRKQLEEMLGEKWGLRFLFYKGDNVMIAQLKDPGDITVLTDDCDRMTKILQRVLGTVVTIGIGTVCSDRKELPGSYNGAREAVSYRVLYGTGRAINIREIAPSEDNSLPYSNNEPLHQIFKLIHMGSEEEIRAAIHDYAENTLRDASTVEHYQLLMMTVMTEFYRFAANNHISHDNINPLKESSYREFSDMDAAEAEEWMTLHALKFHDVLAEARKDSSRSFVEEAKEYVSEHFEDPDLSLDRVCRELGISNSYFSSIFKKETGNSFISYLTQYRLEEARGLLLTTEEKNYAIANRVGYTDANYFSYIFKKQFGMSPSRYRAEHGKADAT